MNKKKIVLMSGLCVILILLTAILPVCLHEKKVKQEEKEKQEISVEKENLKNPDKTVNSSVKEEVELFTGIKHLKSLPLTEEEISQFRIQIEKFLKKNQVTSYSNIKCESLVTANAENNSSVFYAQINDRNKTVVEIHYYFLENRFEFFIAQEEYAKIAEKIKEQEKPFVVDDTLTELLGEVEGDGLVKGIHEK